MTQQNKQKTGKTIKWWELILILLAALICLLAGNDVSSKIRHLRSSGVIGTAIVVDAYTQNHYSTRYVVEFNDIHGKNVITELTYSTTVRVGDTIQIIYNPTNPHTTMSMDYSDWYVGQIVGVLLLFWFGVGLTLKYFDVKV